MYLELFLFVVILIVYLIMRDRKPANMPPGPFEIPFIGGMPIFEEKRAGILRAKYGDICTIRTGNFRTVIIFDYKIGKEALSRHELTGRPYFFKSFSFDDQKTGGLVGSEGAQWQHDRRFVLRNLRNLGMGKSYLEEAINTEAQALVDDLKEYKEEPIDFPDSFRTAVLNIIWQMVASKRYDLRSNEVDSIYQLTKKFQEQPIRNLVPLFFPIVGDLLPTFIKDFVFKDYIFREFIDEMKALINKQLDEHEKDGDIDNPKDLIDEYMREMKDRAEDGTNQFCRHGALMQIVNDLFGAGSDTINNMLKWSAYLLAAYPKVAERIHKEIDATVPRSRLVSLDDKDNLHYVEAFVNETLRFSSMIVFNVQHSALRDTTIAGYNIPKDTVVVVSNYHCHYDPKYWNNPKEFNPDRFLDSDGKFQAPKEGFFAFGQGRRQCLGETLARMELFLFTAAIAQNFDIVAEEGAKLSMDGVNKLGLRVPPSCKLIYKTRK